MKVIKRKLADLNKCYSVAPLKIDGQDRILVAAEKQDPCLLFDTDGSELETVWEGPGGVMSMVQVPGGNGSFLATHKFYSPNDSKEAKIVIAQPGEDGWTVRTLVDLPFVHRFDILKGKDRNWLLACTLKSGHEFKEDWSSPGKVWAAELPADLSGFNEDNQLQIMPIAEELLRNHGYSRIACGDHDECLVGSENGVFRFAPPDQDDSWNLEKLIDSPTSDMLLVDLDEDGKDELITLSPFHGDQISIWKDLGNGFEKIWDYGEKTEFLHAITAGKINGKPTAFIGNRKGKRNLYALTWDPASETFVTEVIDTDRGPANVMYFNKDGRDRLVATNRETDEIAMYEFS